MNRVAATSLSRHDRSRVAVRLWHDAPVTRPVDRFAAAAPLVLGLAGAAAVLLASGGAPFGWLAAAVLVALGLAASWLALTRRATEDAAAAEPVAPPAAPSPAARQPAAALVAAADVHPDPMVIVQAGEGGPRVVYANFAARDVMQLRAEAPLVSVVRHPRVLDRVERALERGAGGATLYQPAGEDRTWRALTAALPSDGTAGQALLVFRDETDARAGQRLGADFLANASHELRTPLASLSGFIETLRGHAKDDPQAQERFLGIMADQAARMSRLVDDLLLLSRIELNEHVPPRGHVDLALAASDVADAVAPVVRSGGRTLVRDLPAPDAACVEGDRDQVVQIVQNLLDNALKYAEHEVGLAVDVVPDAESALIEARAGASRITLVSPPRSTVRSFARLTVRDDGAGIPREHLPRLGERFYRVDGQSQRGTGLGLAIVRHVVSRHRGGLSVESLLGAGTVFRVVIPMKSAEPESDGAL